MGARKLILERPKHYEELDHTPVEIPDQRPLTLREEMQRYIRTELSRMAQVQEHGSFEDEDDFEEEDPDPDWTSPYEVHDMLPDGPDVETPQSMDGTEPPSQEEKLTLQRSPAAADAPGTGSPDEPHPASAGTPDRD